MNSPSPPTNAVKHLRPERRVLDRQKLGKLLLLLLIEAKLLRHFIDGFVAGGNIQRGAGDGGFCLNNIAVAIIGFNHNRFGLGAGAVRNLIHL